MSLDDDVVRLAQGRNLATVVTSPEILRINVLIHSSENPWDWAEFRGRVVDTVEGQMAQDHIDELFRKYVGSDYQNPIGPQGPSHNHGRADEGQYFAVTEMVDARRDPSQNKSRSSMALTMLSRDWHSILGDWAGRPSRSIPTPVH